MMSQETVQVVLAPTKEHSDWVWATPSVAHTVFQRIWRRHRQVCLCSIMHTTACSSLLPASSHKLEVCHSSAMRLQSSYMYSGVK